MIFKGAASWIISSLFAIGCIFFATDIAHAGVGGGGWNSPLWSTQAASPTPRRPHGGYATTTNKCKDCHSVHNASTASGAGNPDNIYKLLRRRTINAGTPAVNEVCDFCHGPNGIVGSKKGIWLRASDSTRDAMGKAGHGSVQGNNETDGYNASAPVIAYDDTTPAFSTTYSRWGCTACHSHHNSDTVIVFDTRPTSSLYQVTSAVEGITGTFEVTLNRFTLSYDIDKLLKRDPQPNDNYELAAGMPSNSYGLAQWCANCHGANFGAYGVPKTVPYGATDTVAYGHDVSTTGFAVYRNSSSEEYAPAGTYAYITTWAASNVGPASGSYDNRGPTCRQCHSAEVNQTAGSSVPTGAAWVTGQVSGAYSGNTALEPGNFPHYGASDSYSLLKRGSNAERTDDVCNDCHRVPDLP